MQAGVAAPVPPPSRTVERRGLFAGGTGRYACPVRISSTGQRPRSIDELISSELCARLDRIDILSRKVFAGKLQGERRSKRRGQSVEFEDYRNYVPGDDLRHVDWNIFARLERFFIKIFQEEEDLSVHIVLDASASMDAGSPTKLVLAMRLAMAIGYIALVNNDRLSLSIFTGRALHRVGPMRGRRNIQRLASFLIDQTRADALGGASPAPPAELSLEGDDTETLSARAGNFTGALRTVASSRGGKGVMLVLSDFLIAEGYQDGLRLLAGGASGYDTYCMQVLSPGELDPSLEGSGAQRRKGHAAGSHAPGTQEAPDASSPGGELVGDVRLIDVETSRGAEVTITADVIRTYKATVRKYIDELRTFCTSRGMNFVDVRSDADLETLLLDYLRKRGLVR